MFLHIQQSEYFQVLNNFFLQYKEKISRMIEEWVIKDNFFKNKHFRNDQNNSTKFQIVFNRVQL